MSTTLVIAVGIQYLPVRVVGVDEGDNSFESCRMRESMYLRAFFLDVHTCAWDWKTHAFFSQIIK